MTPTLKLSKKERHRLVSECLIDRKRELETQEFIYKETGDMVSIKTLQRDKKEIAEEATRFFFTLARDNDYYNQKLKNTVDGLECILSDLRKEYKQSYSPFLKVKYSEQILKYEKEIYEYYKFLPMIKQPTIADAEGQDNQVVDELDEPVV